MAKEIERKFLVTGDEWRGLARGEKFCQGYLADGKNCIVRVRSEGERGLITIKGKRKGITGDEYEYEIPIIDCRAMLNKLSASSVIEKLRYKIPYKGFIWEVDEFLGDNEGLIIAEIELDAEDQIFHLPPWVGEDVSLDSRYTNYSLSKVPYMHWKKDKTRNLRRK